MGLSFSKPETNWFYFHLFLKFSNPTAAGSKCQSGNVPAIATVQSCCQKSPGPGPNMSQNFFLTLSFQKIQTTFPHSNIQLLKIKGPGIDPSSMPKTDEIEELLPDYLLAAMLTVKIGAMVCLCNHYFYIVSVLVKHCCNNEDRAITVILHCS